MKPITLGRLKLFLEQAPKEASAVTPSTTSNNHFKHVIVCNFMWGGCFHFPFLLQCLRETLYSVNRVIEGEIYHNFFHIICQEEHLTLNVYHSPNI